MKSNDNLHKAKKAKNDEFYTRMEDIEKELCHYDLEGKWVYSPCDDYRWSNFKNYFVDYFDKLGITHFTCTNYDIGDGAYRYDYDGTIETITPLEGNGDFRSEECTKIKDECDIVITNPPFSLFREFFKWNDKDFIAICNKNAIAYKEIFPFYMNNTIRFGYNILRFFQLEDDVEKWNIIEDGKKLMDYEGTGRWMTTLPVHKYVSSLKTEPKDNFIKFDNYNAFNTDSIKHIPDTDEEIGCPIGIIDFLPDNYKVVGKLMSGNADFDYGKPYVKGKEKYVRILIKRK